MDPTTQAAVAAMTGAIVAGGGVLAWHLSQEPPTSPAPSGPGLPPELSAVLSVLRGSAVVLDDTDTVLYASATALSLGLVSKGQLTPPELTEAVAQVRRDGEIREVELELHTTRRSIRHVTVRVAVLGVRQVLLLAEDRTRERRVDSVRRDFVANVSHELKTPVGAIKLLAEAVHDAAGDEDAVRRFADRMSAESDRLTSLVQQIIELSRLQADDPLDAPTPVSLDAVISHAVDTCATDADSHEIDLTVEGTRGLTVLGNDKQVTAAVTNLVANAVSYSPPGSPVVISTTVADGSVEISVVDKGIGIPAGEVDRIFERFYRVDPARHRSTGGTGLGLSIVKHVAATHGGAIQVSSVEGEGSTFTLSLPRYEAPTDREDEA